MTTISEVIAQSEIESGVGYSVMAFTIAKAKGEWVLNFANNPIDDSSQIGQIMNGIKHQLIINLE